MAVCLGKSRYIFMTLAVACGGIHADARAEECLSSTDGIAVTCIGQVRQSGLDQLFNNDPAHGRLDSRLADQSWISQEWAAAPFALAAPTSNFSMKMSTVHLGTYADQKMLRRYEEAKALAPDGIILPKPVVGSRNNAFDVWSTLDSSSASLDPGQGVRGGVGADYRLNRNTLLGVSMDFRDGVGNTDVLAEQGRTVAAYFAVKPMSTITFDTTAQWGESAGAASGYGFAAQQNSVQARLRGNWNIERLRFTPTLAFSHGIEHLNASDGGTSTEQNAVTFTPKISRPFALSGGQTLEPFVQYQTELEVGSSDFGTGTTDDVTRSAGAGLTFVDPNAYTLSVTTGVEGINQEQPNLSSRFQLTVPLK